MSYGLPYFSSAAGFRCINFSYFIREFYLHFTTRLTRLSLFSTSEKFSNHRLSLLSLSLRILPVLQHSTLVFRCSSYCGGSACKTRLQKIKTKQNRCVRSIFFAHSRDSAMSYYNLLEILTLENIYKFKLALFIHKINNDPTNIPAIFSGTLTLASEVHSYNTRFATNFNIYRPSISNNYGATTFSFLASKVWESIPSELKKLSYNRFYKQFKMYLLNTQSVS